MHDNFDIITTVLLMCVSCLCTKYVRDNLNLLRVISLARLFWFVNTDCNFFLSCHQWQIRYYTILGLKESKLFVLEKVMIGVQKWLRSGLILFNVCKMSHRRKDLSIEIFCDFCWDQSSGYGHQQ